MNDLLDFLLSNNGAAFGIALLIFIITLWLIIKRFIGFVVTIILLIFALVSGFFVANADLVRELIKGFAGRSTPQEQETLEQLKNQFFKSFEDIKNEISDQKQEFDKILKKAKELENAPPAIEEPQLLEEIKTETQEEVKEPAKAKTTPPKTVKQG